MAYTYDAETLAPNHYIEIPGEVIGIGFSRNGETLASASREAVAVWDVASGTNIHTFPSDSMGAQSMAYSLDGKLIAVASVDGMHFWDVATGKERIIQNQPGAVSVSLAFSPDGKTLAAGTSAGSDGVVRLWDPSSERVIRELNGQQGDYIRSIAFSPNGSCIASGSDDGTVIVWDVRTGAEIFTFRGRGWFNSVSFSRDGSMLASGSSDSTIRLWDVESGQVLRMLLGHTGMVRDIIFFAGRQNDIYDFLG